MKQHMTASTAPHPMRNMGDGVLFVISTVFLTLVALVGQVLFLKWRDWIPGAESETSLFKSVRAGVYTFMSHLN